jgi:hypothetical protein
MPEHYVREIIVKDCQNVVFIECYYMYNIRLITHLLASSGQLDAPRKRFFRQHSVTIIFFL